MYINGLGKLICLQFIKDNNKQLEELSTEQYSNLAKDIYTTPCRIIYSSGSSKYCETHIKTE